MAIFVALLRAVNVGGTGLLPMKDLIAMCESLGFKHVKTYIQSGNVVFESGLPEASAHAKLEEIVSQKLGKKVDVVIRSGPELRAIVKGNPFHDEDPSKVAVFFFSEPLPEGLFETFLSSGGERLHPRERELLVYYPNGMGKSKLKLPKLKGPGTARNIRTITKLIDVAEGLKRAGG